MLNRLKMEDFRDLYGIPDMKVWVPSVRSWQCRAVTETPTLHAQNKSSVLCTLILKEARAGGFLFIFALKES